MEQHSLRDELDEAREEIRQLKQALTPPDNLLPGLSPLGRIILFTLAKAKLPVTQTELTRRADLILGHTYEKAAVPTAIHRMKLRFKMERIPIVIHSRKYRGYWIDDEGRRFVLDPDRFVEFVSSPTPVVHDR